MIYVSLTIDLQLQVTRAAEKKLWMRAPGYGKWRQTKTMYALILSELLQKQRLGLRSQIFTCSNHGKSRLVMT